MSSVADEDAAFASRSGSSRSPPRPPPPPVTSAAPTTPPSFVRRLDAHSDQPQTARYDRSASPSQASSAPSLSSFSSHPPSTASSSSSSALILPYPPPPRAMPASYDHPPAPYSPRRPLPSVPTHASRFIPLHPAAPPPSARLSEKQRALAPRPPSPPDPAVEAKRAYARERGLDDLDTGPRALGTSGVGGGGGSSSSHDDGDEAYSPTTSELPQYAEDPAVLERRRSLFKRAQGFDGRADPASGTGKGGVEVAHGAEKTARAVEDVRQAVNEDMRRQVEADAQSSKAIAARRFEQENGAHERRGRVAEETELRKRVEELRMREEEAERAREEEAPPPPISPGGSREMLPLQEELKKVAPVWHSQRPPVLPSHPSASSFRLPPPPLPATRDYPLPPPPLLPSTSRPSPSADYFSQPAAPPARPPLLPSRTAPASSTSATDEPPVLLSPSSQSGFYSGGISPYGASARYIPTPAPLAAPRRGATRQGSLGPASVFYGGGVGLAAREAAAALEPALPPAAAPDPSDLPLPPASSALSSTAIQVPGDSGAAPVVGSSRIRHRQSLSWSQPGALPPPEAFAPAPPVPTIPRRFQSEAASLDPVSEFGTLPPTPVASSSTFSRPLVHSSLPPRPLQSPTVGHSFSAAAAPPAMPGASIVAAPAFYSSLTPGGPLLPFYPSPSPSGGPPTSYFSPTGSMPTSQAPFGSLPPPPAAPSYQSFAFSSPSLLPPTSASPSVSPPPLSASPARPVSAASAGEPHPWSRSTTASPAGSDGGAPVRTQRFSTIRSLWGRGKKAEKQGGLPRTPEEEGPGGVVE